MKEINRLKTLHQTKGIPEIHLMLNQTGEINIKLPTLRSWFYEQRKPSPQNLQKLSKALNKIKIKQEPTTIKIRVTPGDPPSIYVTGTPNGIATILEEQIEIKNRKLDKSTNQTLYCNLHRLLSKYPNKWLTLG